MPEKVWKQYCPLMKGICIDGFVKGQMPENEAGERTKCAFFIVLGGVNPQDSTPVNDPGCSIHWLPIIFLEGNQFLRSVVATTDKVATEVRNHHATFLGALSAEAKQRLMDADPRIARLPQGGATTENNGSKDHGPKA